jgi:hypothetical protein
MRSSWLREPIKYFLFYAAAAVVVIPCSVAFAFLKSQGYGALILPLPFIVGIAGGLAVIAWFESPQKETEQMQVPQRMVPKMSFVPYTTVTAGIFASGVFFLSLGQPERLSSETIKPNDWHADYLLLFENRPAIESSTKLDSIYQI